MKNLIEILCFVLVSLTLPSCGSSDTVTIKLVPTSGAQSRVMDLSAELIKIANPMMLLGASCRQANIRSAFKLGPDGGGVGSGNENVSTFPISAVTSGVNATTFTASVSNDPSTAVTPILSFDQPIELNIPRGQEAQVGIFGYISEPHDATNSGTCDTNNGTNDYQTISFMGHTHVPTGGNATVPLNLYFFWASYPGGSRPTPPGYDVNGNMTSGGQYYCPAIGSFDTCPVKDYKMVFGTLSNVKILSVKHTYGANGTAPIVQNFNLATQTNIVYLGGTFPMDVTETDVATPHTFHFSDRATVYAATGVTATPTPTGDILQADVLKQ